MSFQPGARFGPYEILALVGAGGMGEVYRARDTRLGREVAIKVLSVAASDAEMESRLRHEAQSIASLNHPHICALYDVGNEGGIAFLVMEFLEGETLAARLVRGPLPLEQAIRYGVQIASAVDAAHRRGVVHGDLKPANVMLTRAGAKLLDFGLAQAALAQVTAQVDPDGTATTRHALPLHTTIGGTLPYMAPEQLEGKHADSRADIFSFGAVLYEMVTGRRAFAGGTQGRIVATVLTETPPAMVTFQPSVPPALEQLVMTCLAKDREERWQSANDLTRTLGWIAEGSGAMSREDATTMLPLVPPTIRGRPWFMAAAVVVIAASAGIASWRGAAVNASPRNVVVLPCRSLGDTLDKTFCDGIAETLTARLTQISSARDLQVVPASHVRDERVGSVEQARTVFGATLAFEGSLLRAGDVIRLNYIIVDTRTRQQVDAVSLTVPAGDPFGLQDQVVEWATRKLALVPTGGERQALRARGTHAPDAYALYQQGTGRLSSFQTVADIDAAIDLFNKAVQLDPRYALAHVGLGEAYWRRHLEAADAASLEKAREECAAALSIDERLGRGHVCAGSVAFSKGQYDESIAAFRRAVDRDAMLDEGYLGLARAYERKGDRAAAERTYREAVERRPRYSVGHQWLGMFLVQRGRYAEGVEAYQRAVALNPGSARLHALLGGAQIYAGRYDDAVASFRDSVAITPTYPALANWGITLYRQRRFDAAGDLLTQACLMRQSYQCLGNLARVHWYAGRPSEATTLLERAITLAAEELMLNPSNIDARVAVAEYHAKLGHRQAALEHAAHVSNRDDPHMTFFLALVHAQLADEGTAVDLLRKARRAGLPAAELVAWPELDSLRRNATFQKLVKAAVIN
jgi:eukaryotic-like serine/threonine-protein kinase